MSEIRIYEDDRCDSLTPEGVDRVLREAGFDPVEVAARFSALAEKTLRDAHPRRRLIMYDSAQDTVNHIAAVGRYMKEQEAVLRFHRYKHDDSKLQEPEKSFFDKYKPLLDSLAYGSPEYMQALADLRPAIDHHYQANSHHPEHYPNDVSDMTLFDLLEMLADWKASAQLPNSDELSTVEAYEKRFHALQYIAGIGADSDADGRRTGVGRLTPKRIFCSMGTSPGGQGHEKTICLPGGSHIAVLFILHLHRRHFVCHRGNGGAPCGYHAFHRARPGIYITGVDTDEDEYINSLLIEGRTGP